MCPRVPTPWNPKRFDTVYTPFEDVGFILRAVNDVLTERFSASLTDESAHLLDALQPEKIQLRGGYVFPTHVAQMG